MKTPLDEIWSDLLRETATNDFRQAILQTTLARARQRRYSRRIAYGSLLAAILVLAVLATKSFETKSPRPTPNLAGTPEYIPGTTLRVVGDEELLALFDGPRALIGPPGHRQLVLLGKQSQ